MDKIKVRRLELALVLAFILTCLASVAGFAVNCAQVRGNVLRLHVIANSDSEQDQALKLRVRDAVLQAGNTLFDGSATVESAREKLEAEMDTLTAAAEREVTQSGESYPVEIAVTDEYFSTRVYEQDETTGETLTLPAGRYTAVKITIGAGEGKNWWCVMFPPLCLPAAEKNMEFDAYFDGEYRVVEQKPQYEPRFKIVEWVEQLRAKGR